MIKKVTQYVVVCDNSFCDAVVKSVVDFHSDDRRQQFERKIKNLGWEIQKDNITGEAKNFICPDCLLFSSELEKRHSDLRPIKLSA